jgi:hypothetical protein
VSTPIWNFFRFFRFFSLWSVAAVMGLSPNPAYRPDLAEIRVFKPSALPD